MNSMEKSAPIWTKSSVTASDAAAAMFLVILEPLLIAHPLRLVVVPVDFPNRLHYLPALDGEDLFEVLELTSTMRQAVGVDLLSPLLTVDRSRVRHLNRRRQHRVSLLQHVTQILARMPAATEIERDLSPAMSLTTIPLVCVARRSFSLRYLSSR